LKALTKTFNLRFVHLTSIPLDNTLANDLAEIISNNNHSLDHLLLLNCSLSIEGFLKVADALKITTVLKHLNVSSNYVTSCVMDKLTTAGLFFKNSQLNHLDISECQWDRNSLSKMFLAMKELHNLKCINCSGCKMDFIDYLNLGETIISSRTLEQLLLANFGLSNTRLVRILSALKVLKTLCHLDVSSNQNNF